jgi:A/G-specific adenine glycosylase
VKRVLARHRGIDRWPCAPAIQQQLWRAAEALLPDTPDGESNIIAAYTQGMMDIGAMVCTRVRPRCSECPVSDDCIARRDARVDALPSPRPRRTLPQRAITVLMLVRNGEILLEQRPPLGIWGGLWSFPEAPLGDDVDAHLSTRFNATADSIERLPLRRHVFTHFALTMHPVRVRVARWPDGVGMPGIAWFAAGSVIAAAVPAPIRKLLVTLAQGSI